MKNIIFLFFTLFALSVNAQNKHYTLQGTLGDSSRKTEQTIVSFRLDLEEDEYLPFVIGEVTYYRKSGRASKIKVYGYSNQEFIEGYFHTITLQEFNGTKVCGNWSLIFDRDDFVNGSWSLAPDKYYDMENVNTITADPTTTYFSPVDLNDATGVYKYSYDFHDEAMSEYGGTLELFSQERNLAFSICQTTPDITEIYDTASEYWDNHLFFNASGTSYILYAYDGVMFVLHTINDDESSEDSDASTNIVETYIATDQPVSDKLRNAFAEEEAFSSALPCTIFQLNNAWTSFAAEEFCYPHELILKDIDGDGSEEIIARYLPDKNDEQDMSSEKTAIFVITEGSPVCIQYATNELESLEIADGYIIKTVRNARNTRTTYHYTKLFSSDIELQATMTKAAIDSWTINENTVKEKDFKKQVKIKNRIGIQDLTGWKTIPGNRKRNKQSLYG